MPSQSFLQNLQNTKRTWLVTGAAGFIGSHIAAKLLDLNQNVVVLDNLSSGKNNNLPVGVKFIEADIRDSKACRDACDGIDIVLHHAAIGSVVKSITDPVLVDSVNVNGTINLLQAAAAVGVKRFVYASSSAVYGDFLGSDVCIEHQALYPKSPYAVTKRACELYAAIIGKHHGICTVGLRYFNVYGARQDPNGAYAAVIPKWIDAVLSNNSIEIYGDGETVRDFCYIDDVVMANLQAALADSDIVNGQSYNIASGAATTLNELYRTISEVNGKAEIAPIYYPFREGDIRISRASIEKALKDFSYKPETELLRGLTQTIAAYRG